MKLNGGYMFGTYQLATGMASRNIAQTGITHPIPQTEVCLPLLAPEGTSTLFFKHYPTALLNQRLLMYQVRSFKCVLCMQKQLFNNILLKDPFYKKITCLLYFFAF